MVQTLQDFGETRDTTLRRISEFLQADARVQAAWLSGSFGRGEVDAWSDLDLHVVVEDEHLATLVAAPGEMLGSVGEPLLIYGGILSNSMPDGFFWLVQYAPGMLQVDWNIGPVSAATRPAASHVLFDKMGVPVTSPPPPVDDDALQTMAAQELKLFWAMAPIAVKFVGRGHTRLAVKQVDYLERAYIALWRVLNHPAILARDAYHQNRPLEAALDAQLPRFGSIVDPLAALAVIRAFCAATQALHPTLAAMGVTVDARVVEEVAMLAAIAETEAKAGGSHPNRGSRR